MATKLTNQLTRYSVWSFCPLGHLKMSFYIPQQSKEVVYFLHINLWSYLNHPFLILMAVVRYDYTPIYNSPSLVRIYYEGFCLYCLELQMRYLVSIERPVRNMFCNIDPSTIQIDRQMYSKVDRWMDGQIDRQIDRQIEIERERERE